MAHHKHTIGDINPLAALQEAPSFTLTSDDIAQGEYLPGSAYNTDSGENLSPHLAWSEFPEDTKSFVVTCFDPDAPTGSGFWHWAVANIPASVTSLPQGAGAADSELLPEGAITLPNELRDPAWTGAAPPEGTGVHHYWFVVSALDVESIDVDPEATPAVLGFLIRDHVIGRAVLVAKGEFGKEA